jgi:hypothetical protein
MKNIQIIDGALNCVYDIFQATESEFNLIFKNGTNIMFSDELDNGIEVEKAFENIWARRIPKDTAMGIHGTIFYQMEHKKEYYPTRKDEEAKNPNGSKLR